MAKVYYQGRSRNHRLHVQPGIDYPGKAEWHEIDGRAKYYEVHFVDYMADVDDHLAHYLINKGLASKSPLVTGVT